MSIVDQSAERRGLGEELDELLQPSLPARASRRPAGRPWRLSSQLWVAFLGGTAAYLPIALVNGARLGVPRRKLLVLGLVGLVALAASIGVAVYLLASHPPGDRTGRQLARLGGRLVAVLYYLLVRRQQVPHDRTFQVLRDGEHASLWVPGLLAVFGLGTLQNLAAWGLSELWR